MDKAVVLWDWTYSSTLPLKAGGVCAHVWLTWGNLEGCARAKYDDDDDDDDDDDVVDMICRSVGAQVIIFFSHGGD